MRHDQHTQAAWAMALRMIADKNESALALFYDQTSAYVHSLVFRILGNDADAEEITLDVYVQVWNKAAQYQTMRGTPLGWLLMIARSRAIDRLRSRAIASDHVNLEVIAGALADPELRHSDHERSELMSYLIGCLPSEQRTLIDAAFFQGMTQSEMAESMHLPLGTVKTRMRLGLKKLRLLIETTGQRGLKTGG